MTVSREFATNHLPPAPDAGGGLLVCAPNWLGDLVMALPAIRGLGRTRPAVPVTVLCKPALIPLWRLFNEPIDILTLDSGWQGTWRTIGRLRAARCDRAVILPNSFRSAWLPFAARIPVRRGFPGHQRRWLLTDPVRRPASAVQPVVHQCEEYALLTGNPVPEDTAPLLSAPESLRLEVTGRWGRFMSGQLLLLFPGAARGPSKRWPAAAFAELGRQWHRDGKGTVLISGTSTEQDLCDGVARAIGDAAVNLAGKTTLPELAAVLSLCSVVVANDSGGAHLAAALATPVVVIFGLTDPAVTAPRGGAVRVVTAPRPPAAASRRIARNNDAAQSLLAAIPVAAVQAAIEAVLAQPRGEETT